MSDTKCGDCGTVMDQSDACRHACPPDPIRKRIEVLEAQVRSLQMAAPRGIPEASAPMDERAAVETINNVLRIDGAVTHVGHQLKCYVADDEGGRCKTYLDADECSMLRDAFAALAVQFQKGALGR